jgi:DNA invertase Pin-like site-specific DNA recombinase
VAQRAGSRKPHDTLVVCGPDRLARSTTELLMIVDDPDRRSVGLIMLSMDGQRIDTRSPTGKLMATMRAGRPTASANAAEVIRLDAEH